LHYIREQSNKSLSYNPTPLFIDSIYGSEIEIFILAPGLLIIATDFLSEMFTALKYSV